MLGEVSGTGCVHCVQWSVFMSRVSVGCVYCQALGVCKEGETCLHPSIDGRIESESFDTPFNSHKSPISITNINMTFFGLFLYWEPKAIKSVLWVIFCQTQNDNRSSIRFSLFGENLIKNVFDLILYDFGGISILITEAHK